MTKQSAITPLSVTITQVIDKNNRTKTVSLAKVLSSDVDPRLLVKTISLSGYRLKMVKLSDQKYSVLVLDHTVKTPKLDKDGNPIKNGKRTVYDQTVEQIAEVFEFTRDPNTGEFICSDSRFDSGFGSKLYLKLVGSLATQPIILLAERGIIEKARLGKVLCAVMTSKYDCTHQQAQQLAVAYYHYTKMNREYQVLSPNQTLSYLFFNAPSIKLIEDKSVSTKITDTQF